LRKNFCILQVEDDENDIIFLQHAFKEAGITNPIQVITDGQQAVDYLSGSGKFADPVPHPRPCLILLDLKLPRKSGLEVLHWLRQNSKLPWIPVIVFSSSTQPEDIEKAYQSGASSFVVKPASVEKRVELAQLIRAYWLGFNEPPVES
jgi:CheY-like chemotaxis protein